MTIPYSLTQGAYIVAGLMFILALAGLSKHESAPMGNRYGIIGLDDAMFDEMCEIVAPRNQLSWFSGDFDPPTMQFEFNGLWFDTTFHILKF